MENSTILAGMPSYPLQCLPLSLSSNSINSSTVKDLTNIDRPESGTKHEEMLETWSSWKY